MPNKNSKVSISYIATLSASLIVLGSSLFYASCNKASLIFGAWNFNAFTLSIQLSQHVGDNVLTVKPDTFSCKIVHHLMEEENNEYICCTTPKKDI